MKRVKIYEKDIQGINQVDRFYFVVIALKYYAKKKIKHSGSLFATFLLGFRFENFYIFNYLFFEGMNEKNVSSHDAYWS